MAELPTGTVTLLFTDIEGSTRLLRRVGDAYADLLAEHRRLLTHAFEHHGGTIVDSEGDAFFVAFASARDAVAGAEAGQRALIGHPWPGEEELRVRMGLHTGEPRLVDGRYVGLDVHHAARLMAAGHGGQVLVSESTRALLDDGSRLRDLGEHRLKDLSHPQRLYQLEVDGLPTAFPPLKTLDNRPTNLPVQPNELIGRERELEEAEALLSNGLRVLTLTGPGGTGKTRLALQLAAHVVEEFPDGVFFVSLAPVRDWELVAPTIARTLGLREQPGETVLETLDGYLGDKELLLVLDNFEQVLAAAPAVAGLCASASRLKLLVTSRTPLRLSGERTYPVPPLELAESVRLFAARAHAAALDFDVTEENEDAVAGICRRLDGLPLAIELAATRIRSLPPPALLRRLDQRLKLLTGGAQDLDERQRTLRATIDWSYELLPQAERDLFARLGVFVGGSRLDAAEALCGAIEIDVLDGLQSLVEKSLLRQRPDPDGEPRFWMLETIREFALGLLDEAGDAGGGAARPRRLVPRARRACRRRVADRRPVGALRPARRRQREPSGRGRLRRGDARRRIAAAAGDRALGLLGDPWAHRRRDDGARERARARRATAGARAARPLHAPHPARAGRGARGRHPRGASGLRGARRPLQPGAGLEPAGAARRQRARAPRRGRARLARGAPLRRAWRLRRREDGERQLALDQRDLRAAARGGGDRALQGVRGGGGRRAGNGGVLQLREGGTGGDALQRSRRPGSCWSPAGVRSTSSACRCGPPLRGRRRSSSRCSGATPPPPRRRC